MNYHTTTPKILNTLILSLMLVPIETHATTVDLFLTFLTQRKSSCQDSSHLVFLIKFYFYLFTTPQNQNQTTLCSLPYKSSHLASLLSHHCPLLSFLTFLPYPASKSSSSSHLFASLCQSPSKNLIHRSPKTFSLG
jgi:hypothetical protein